MNWIQRLLCPDSSRIAQLEQESAARAESIKMLVTENGTLKAERFALKAKSTVPDFAFDMTVVKTISSDKLRAILTDAFLGKEIMLNDGTYKYTTLAEVQRWASFDPNNELVYRAEELDCDKYALIDMADFKRENNFQLGNSAFGIGRGYAAGIGYHEWNIAYVEEGIITLEPQSDLITKWKDNQDYKPDFIYI